MTHFTTYNNTPNTSSQRSNDAISNAIFAHFSYSTFTGKELDAETGYGYFGARYYDPTLMTSWTAVDPMADKYPNISPYAYCAWNPLKLIDPTGREFETIIDHHNRTITIRATFTSYSGNKKEQKIIDQAVNNWNLSSFALSLKDENGQAVDYTVNFDINNGHGPNNSVSFIPDELFDQKYSKHSTAGGVSDGQNIIVKVTSKNSRFDKKTNNDDIIKTFQCFWPSVGILLLITQSQCPHCSFALYSNLLDTSLKII